MNPYAIAYAIGYFYGRAYPRDVNIPLPEEDQSRVDSNGFHDGLEAGRRDYEAIDLPLVALAETPEAE